MGTADEGTVVAVVGSNMAAYDALMAASSEALKGAYLKSGGSSRLPFRSQYCLSEDDR